MRAVVLDEQGRPALAEVPEPDGDGELVRVLACGLCGSDVEKIGAAPAGTVLGHEVVAEAAGRRVALVHHLPCGECDRCLAGHESTCEAFGAATIVPGGFAERVRARPRRCRLPDGIDDATRDLRRAARLRPPRGRTAAARTGARSSGTASSGGCSAPFSGVAATTSSRSTTTRDATDAQPDGARRRGRALRARRRQRRRPRTRFRAGRCSSSRPPRRSGSTPSTAAS